MLRLAVSVRKVWRSRLANNDVTFAYIFDMDFNVYLLIPDDLPKSTSASDETVEMHSPHNLIHFCLTLPLSLLITQPQDSTATEALTTPLFII